MRRITEALLLSLLCACYAGARGVVTQSVDLVSTSSASRDGQVYITRSGADLVLYDAGASTTTLSSLGAGVTDHGALSGLSDDDHSAIYLNTGRHSSAHDSTFNNALAITGDVGGEVTLGAHVADTATHWLRDSSVFEVYADGTGPYATIQAAATAAGDGDVIIVHPGTYTETVVLPRNVMLWGNDPRAVFIRQATTTPTITITDYGILSGVTVLNTAAVFTLAPAIEIADTGTIGATFIRGCNVGTTGYGAIYSAGDISSLTVDGCNIACGSGEALSTHAWMRVVNSHLTSNNSSGRPVVRQKSVGASPASRCEIDTSRITASAGVGMYLFEGASSSLLLHQVFHDVSSSVTLFQSSTAAGVLYEWDTNYDLLGAPSAITRVQFKGGAADYSQRVKIYDESASVIPFQIVRQGDGAGDLVEMTDGGSVVARVTDAGEWRPASPAWATVDGSTTATYWLSPWVIWAWDDGNGAISPGDWATETTPSVSLDVANLGGNNRVGFDLSGARWDKITELRLQYAYGDGDPLRVRMGVGEYTGVATTQYSAYGTTTTTTRAIQDQRFDISDISRDAGAAYWGWLQVDCAVDDYLDVYRIGIVYGEE